MIDCKRINRQRSSSSFDTESNGSDKRPKEKCADAVDDVDRERVVHVVIRLQLYLARGTNVIVSQRHESEWF
jgi:hypothetical protein